ncbi:selenide, water dikinase SelD [Vineibacter terrae]|uniref:selenide, water dikinase SelD n=1 Tax=Vineibacter terrae TaxID=2586908 RepID=UPI001C49BD40|nr:selenide, water dikinase SelD [Vineibacter terrae]
MSSALSLATTVKPRLELVLVGGGHAHVEVLRQAAMKRPAHVRLTVIARDLETPYSGMLPGLLAGHYSHGDAHIDLRPLCQAAGARLYHAEAIGLDLIGQQVLCDRRPPVPFERLSLDIGSRPDMASVPGAAQHTLPVKPVDGFRRGWAAIEAGLRDGIEKRRITVIGAGAGGVELCLALQHRLAQAGLGGKASFALVTKSATVLPTHPPAVQRIFSAVLAERGVAVTTGQSVKEVQADAVVLDDGTTMPSDVTLWVVDAGAPAWLRDTGLALDDRGFVKVNQYLQSTSHADVFGAGDVIAFGPRPLAKAGVFAVREGPVLAHNLLGSPDAALQAYVPQRRFLTLVSTGNQHAVGARGRLWVRGDWVWRWKNRIDRRWMRMYQALRPGAMAMGGMAPAAADGGDAMAAMRCAGCGAKIDGDILRRALHDVAIPPREGVLLGVREAEDASAIAVPPGQALVQSVDFFRALIDDPWLFGRIASLHCLSDLFATGAAAHSALMTAVLPHAPPRLQENDLRALLRGVVEELKHAGATLIGGHTGEGMELSLGLTVNGLAPLAQLLRKGALKAGDTLILTKALGTGALFAADMRGEARAPWVIAAIDSMLRSNGPPGEAARAAGAIACTDITGFGLAGHLLEMLRASVLDAELSLGAVPTLPGAADLAARGIESTMAPANRAAGERFMALATTRAGLLFDPQTSGGLLIGIAADKADALLAALRPHAPDAAVIGRVLPRAGAGPRIALVD